MGVDSKQIEKSKSNVAQKEADAKAAENKKAQDFANATTDSKESGKKAIRAGAFEGKTQEEIQAFLQENKDKFLKFN
jgi:hypothetical protein